MRCDVGDEDLPARGVEGRRRPVGRELARSHSVADLLLRLGEGLASTVPCFEDDEAVAFGLPGVLVHDDIALFDLAEVEEGVEEDLVGGVPAEAVDEDLAVDGVGVGGFADSVDDRAVLHRRLFEDLDELVFPERF
ncbi:hypothetical protein Syun_005421 [Stephania yunnanensis]|uniref:Uncharacterized protein n=1 Tax=Stephania yunnanensis TaxID=152371 RepID=A0AAP0L8V2_9MAGN